MINRESLCDYVIEALNANNGAASIVQICRHIWESHEEGLRESGDLFYTWQYDIRWAGQKLRDRGILLPVNNKKNQPWRLKP